MTNEHDTSARGFGMTENRKLFIHGYKNGLPIGVQFISDCFTEKKLLNAAYAYEQARGEILFGKEGK